MSDFLRPYIDKETGETVFLSDQVFEVSQDQYRQITPDDTPRPADDRVETAKPVAPSIQIAPPPDERIQGIDRRTGKPL